MSDNSKHTISYFEEYARNMEKVRILSSPVLESVEVPDEYAGILTDNFLCIRNLADINKMIMKEVFEPILNSDEELSEETIEAIRKMNIALQDAYHASQMDVPVISLFADRLMKDSLKKDDKAYIIRQLDSEIENCYFIKDIYDRLIGFHEVSDRFRKKGLEAFEEILKYLDKKEFESLDEESRELVLINSRYGQVLCEDVTVVPEETIEWRLKILRKAEEVAVDPFYRKLTPGLDWDRHIYKIHEYFAMMGVNDNAMGLNKAQLEEILLHAQILNDMLEKTPDKILSYTYPGYPKKLLYIALHNLGRMTDEEFLESLRKLYNDSTGLGNDDNDSVVDARISVPLEMLLTYRKMELSEKDKDDIKSIYDSVTSFALQMPKLGMMGSILGDYVCLLDNYIEIPGMLSFEEMGLRSFAALHPPTYVHSYMVARISTCLAGHLLKKDPSRFIGVCGAESVQDVSDNADGIVDFVFHSALCHDFGKLCIMDTIFVYGRKLLDYEFEIIKFHPLVGYNMLRKHKSTEQYADIALGHHISYDGKKGYPTDRDISQSIYKTVIDLVEFSDCMDAATDTVGRSYTDGKDLDKFRIEVSDESGTKYADYLVELIDDEAVRSDLEYLLSEGRKDVYKKTYDLLRSV